MTDASNPIPSFFIKRVLDGEYEGKRLLENEEIGLLSLLTAEEKVATQEHLLHLMRIMLRVEKIEHRALCMEILVNHLSEPQFYLDFANFGGYRLMKKWLKRADEEKVIPELRYLVQFLRKLPFDSSIIKSIELGKLIKRLQKITENTTENQILQKEVAWLMEEWKEKAALEKKELMEKQAKEAPIQPATPVAQSVSNTTVASPSKPSASLSSPKSKPVSDGMAESKTGDRMDVDDLTYYRPVKTNLPAANAMPTSSGVALSKPMLLKGKELLPILLQSQQNPPVPAPATSVATTPTPAATKVRKPIDMLEGARRLLAANKQASAKPAAENEGEGLENVASVMNKDLKPLAKGGLKRSGNSSAGAEKRSLRWADEHGGLLRHTQYIEVDKIRSSLSSYKSHKDLVRKERALERETYSHLSKEGGGGGASGMAVTLKPYPSPAGWSLSLGIRDNRGQVGVGGDKEAQTRRMAHVLEARYLDESLIPDDPDTLPNLTPSPANPSSSAAVPFLLPGEEAELAPIHSTHTTSALADPSSSSSNNNIYGAGSFRDEAALLSSLPIAIQMLDPLTIDALLHDPPLLATLLVRDEQGGVGVDERRLSLLQACPSVEEYKRMLQMGGGMDGAGWGGGGMNMGMGYEHQPPPVFRPPPTQAWEEREAFYPVPHASHAVHANNNPWQQTSSLPPATHTHAHVHTPHASSSGARRSSKANIPCRFFPTARGCANGDRCPFGHFVEAGMGLGGMGGGGMGGGRVMGPGGVRRR